MPSSSRRTPRISPLRWPPGAVPVRFLRVAAICVACSSCSMFGPSQRVSPKQAMAAPNAPFAEQAIVVQVRPDAQLNVALGQAHTLVLGVLQAPRTDTLSVLADQPARVEQALVSAREAPGLLQITRFIIQPGQRCTARVDRVRGALAVGLALGYAQPGSGRRLRVFEVPVGLSSSGWVLRSYMASAQPLHIRLLLGPTEVLAAEAARAAGPDAPACQSWTTP